ncbi:MAG: peptidylprolyl isomerase [Saprospiraceae bacterium]|nr:peptidylprolyl isomerase [Saprospiraceae bacterium]
MIRKFRNIHSFPSRTILSTVAILTVLLLVSGCLPPEKQAVKQVQFGFEDPVTRQIYDLQDRMQQDSLCSFFHHDDPTYRYYAVMAMASIGDSTSIDSLIPLLRDPNQDIQLACIYALGQIRSSRAELPLLEAFDPWDSLSESSVRNSAILEAIGKCGSEPYLEAMASVTTYEPTDSLYQIGLANGVFQYSLRGIIHPLGTTRMIEMVTDERRPERARLIAATYLARTAGIKLDTLVPEMVNLLRSEPNPDHRMALALAIGKSGSELARSSLMGLFPLEKDPMVRCNMVRALSNFPYVEVKDVLLSAFQDKDPYVGITASQVLMDIGDPKETPEWLTQARTTRDPWVKAYYYVAISRICPVFLPVTRTAVQSDLRHGLESIKDPHLRAVYVRALGKFGWNFPYLLQIWQQNKVPVVKTAAMEAIRDISDRPDFATIFGASSRNVRKNLAQYFLAAIESGDVGSMATAAGALRAPNAGYRLLVHSDSTFRKAMNLCQLPQDIETYNELAQTRAYFQKSTFKVRHPEFNHPIDWELVGKVKANSRAVIKTNRGNIIIRFFPEDAPGSVGNFIQLAESGYFSGKTFHRLVPNFVIQGGCPRGDGYGALGYSIRSELNRKSYDLPGRVGMASAGPHTEGTQFFITHSPTLHLDGRYSLFAEVETGLDIVRQILPGDTIEEVEMIY